MRPGQITTTELEAAILERIAKAHPKLASRIGQLHVLSREFTGVGCYTKFALGQPMDGLPDGHLPLDELLTVPGVPGGLGAILFCDAGNPTFLEIYTFGNELWDGDASGFAIGEAA